MHTVVLLICLSAVSTIFAIITMTADQMYVQVGGDVHISCTTDVKETTITIFNGTLLMSSCSIFVCQLYDNKTSSTLPVRDDTHPEYDTVSFELRNFQLKDAGTYTCKDINSNNSVQDSVTITDAEVPGPPSNLQSSERVTDSSVTITWLPGFDGGLPQTFIVQFRDTSAVTWIENEVKTAHPSHTIYNLEPGTTYEIKVVARNSLGNSSASEIITVTTLNSSVTDKPPPKLAVIIGGPVGGVAGIGLLAIVLLVVLKFRQKVINSTYGGGANDQNISADTVYSNSNMAYDQGASSDVYTVVNKKKKDIIGNSDKRLQSTGGNNSSGNNRHDNHDVLTGTDMTRKNLSQDGLVYADLEFPNQPKGLKPVKHGMDDMTEYAEVDRTQRADPLLEVHDDG